MASPQQYFTPHRQNSDERRQDAPTSDSMAQSSGIPQRLRRNEESWVEISSQPSSSSLSSIGDEIVTTGLRVQHHPRARRRTDPGGVASPVALEARHAGTSSQEEYEESESEEDHGMTSSNEHITPSTRLSALRQEYHGPSDSDDDDENATALGPPTQADFRPQPNAFSHPPTQTSLHPGASYPRSAHSAHTRPPFLNRASSRTQYASYNQADHDAALRASLTTLLSIGAAAARSLPKRNQAGAAVGGNQPVTLGFVPESELGAATTAANNSGPHTPSPRPRSSPSISSEEALEMGKRKAVAAPKSASEKTRVTKKKKVQLAEEVMISPTLLTWVVSASVVVLVSVVGFGAGYVIGREVGRGEAFSGLNGSTVLDPGSCGREVARSSTGTLRRFRWGSTMRSIVA